MALSLAEQMIYSATRLTTFQDDAPVSTGTGFFYQVNLEDGRFSVLLVTNRHVLMGCNRVDLSLPIRGEDGMPTGGFHGWQIQFVGEPIGHPNPQVDLVALSVTELHQVTPAGQKRYPFYAALSRRAIPDEGSWTSFDAIEDVVMIGCPNGLFDATNNLPIMRRGITATHPGRNYQGKAEFMVDFACFPGSSGSPVFLYSTGATFNRGTGGFDLGKIRLYFLGVLYAGPTINQRGEIVLGKEPSISTSMMMHLGIVIKSTELFEFDSMVHKALSL